MKQRGPLSGNHRSTRLSREVVLQIRREAFSQEAKASWAEKLGTSFQNIYSIYSCLTYVDIVERPQDNPNKQEINSKRYTTWSVRK